MALIETGVFEAQSKVVNARAGEMVNSEFTASDVRRILQRLFPQRKLVLSQLTFFNHAGVACANGDTYKRGRRCYLLQDILSVATVLALKEEGIPLKNINGVPALIQQNAKQIFSAGQGCRLVGFGSNVSLEMPGSNEIPAPLQLFLNEQNPVQILWGFDVGALAQQLNDAANSVSLIIRRAA